jgi:hypothetical protein
VAAGLVARQWKAEARALRRRENREGKERSKIAAWEGLPLSQSLPEGEMGVGCLDDSFPWSPLSVIYYQGGG